MGIAGAALRDSGEGHEALKMFDEAAALGAPESLWRYASALSAQTLLVLDMRDWERAASLMNNLSRVVPMFDSAALDTYVAQILRASEPWSTAREVRDARERLQSVRLTNPN